MHERLTGIAIVSRVFVFRGVHTFQLFTLVCFKGVYTCFFHRSYNIASLPYPWGRIAIAAWPAALDPEGRSRICTCG